MLAMVLIRGTTLIERLPMNHKPEVAVLAAVPPQPGRRRPAFYNVAETAEITGLDESTLYRHLRQGKFPGIKIGGRYVVPHAVLERLIADVLATGRCVDIADWTDKWREEQEALAAEQARILGAVAAGGASW
ncbi:MAG: helix-turn-helix domain-containing protein [Actinophytocola sp.]|nr:helix-turn-helix domain-containing protein [Actinophytocola sp.]